MEAILIMIPVAILLGAGAVGAFIWATKNGQFDDMDTPSSRMLFDDESKNINNQKPTRGES